MDLEAIKVLLETQERTFRSAMKIVVDELKERVRLVESTVTDLIKSLEFSQAEIRDLKSDTMVLRKADVDKQVIIDGLQTRIAELERRQNYQEDYNRRNNLRITGFKEEGSETWEQTAAAVSALLQDKLQLPNVKLERAHRVGPRTLSTPRPVVVRFEKYSDREAAIRNSRKLKGTGIYMNEDLCPASIEKKKEQIPTMKKARAEGKIAFFRHTRLIIKERPDQRSSYPAAAAQSTSRGSGAGGTTTGSDGEGATVTVPASPRTARGVAVPALAAARKSSWAEGASTSQEGSDNDGGSVGGAAASETPDGAVGMQVELSDVSGSLGYTTDYRKNSLRPRKGK